MDAGRGASFDATEDLLHSVAATGMGFTFAAGVLVVGLGRIRAGGRMTAADVAALAASVLLPLGMSAWPELAGLLQRAMSATAYLWYALETRGLERLAKGLP